MEFYLVHLEQSTKIGKETGILGNKMMINDQPDNSITMIGLNKKKNPIELKRL